jgi:hypothetical protein
MRMSGIYGHKWVSSFGESDADDSWAIGLSGFTGADIARGLKACMTSSEEWPPTLPQFRKLCMEFQTPAHRPFPPADRLIESDELRQARKDKAAQMRALWRSMR